MTDTTRLCEDHPCRNTAHPDCTNRRCVGCCDMLCDPSECRRAGIASDNPRPFAVATLRDEFAKAALIGLLSMAGDGPNYDYADAADRAYKYADAMIARRSQT